MDRNEALTVLRLAGRPDSSAVEKAFREREYEIEQKLIHAPPEEGIRVTLNYEMERVRQARSVLGGSAAAAPSRRSRGRSSSGSSLGDPVSTGPQELPPVGPDTVTLSLPPAARPFQPGGGSRLKAIGAWAVRILALVAVLAGIFVYLTQFGPLSDWWRSFTRDDDRVSHARSLRTAGESLERKWTENARLLRVEEPAEIAQARAALARGNSLLDRFEDESAITAYLEAKNRFEVGLQQLGEVRRQLRQQGEGTVEEIQNLFKEIEKAEWGVDRRERDASEEVHRVEENLKAARGREDRRRIEAELKEARNRLGLARDVQGACARMVFESDRLPEIQGDLARAVTGLEDVDVLAAVGALAKVKEELESLLALRDDISRTVQELWSCEQLLESARDRAGATAEPLFEPAARRLHDLRENLTAENLADVRESLPAIRADVEHIERLLPARGEIARQAGRLDSAHGFPALDQRMKEATALCEKGDDALRSGKPDEAEKSYRAAGKALESIEVDTVVALLSRARESVEKGDSDTARQAIADVLRLDPLNADAMSLRKKLSGPRESSGIVVPDDAKTLQGAILIAKPGEVIRLRAGVYEGGVTFKEGIHIEGAGADKVTIRCGAKEANVIKVKDCASGSITGVTLEHVGTDLDEHRFSCLHVENSTIQVKGVVMRNAAGNGVMLTGGGSSTVTGCTVQGSGWFGIYFAERGGGTAFENVCSRNGFSGIAVLARERVVTVRANQCRNNGLHGIYFGEGSQGQVTENVVEHNRGSGIAVRGAGAKPVLTDNRCVNNRQFGIYFDGGAGGTAESNVCDENDYSGIAAVGTASSLSIRRNKCVGNRRDGIYLFDGAQGTAEENTCERNEDSGIAAIGTHSSLVLRRNRCLNNKTWGIYFGGSAGGRAEGNVCERNTRDGIAVAESGTTTTVKGNRCALNRGDGIHFAKGTGGSADQNICEKNHGYGIYADPGSSVRVGSTSVSGNSLGDLGGKAKPR